jgi:hypothetical protein
MCVRRASGDDWGANIEPSTALIQDAAVGGHDNPVSVNQELVGTSDEFDFPVPRPAFGRM